MVVDHKELLKKYVHHVIECEGTDFINHMHSDVEFGQDEIDELTKISEEHGS